jgi:predicted acylesterase/phospholipase RssA
MRALVFSAGATFGAYHAGAWQALEEARYRPAILAGASVGSITAAAVARGATARRLQEWWRDPRSNVFRGDWSRTLLGRLEELVQEFPPGPTAARLRVTVTRLPSTRIEVLEDRQVDAQVLLASSSIPVFFKPVRLAGGWYVDGGIFHRLPAALAAQAGATELVAVDLLAVPPSPPLRLVLRAVTAVRRALVSEPDYSNAAPLHALLIHSTQRLGSVLDLLRWDRVQIDRWIDQGYEDARRALAAASPAHIRIPRADSAAPA